MRVIFRAGTVRHSNFGTLPQKTAKRRAGHDVCSIAVEDSTMAVSIAARCNVGPYAAESLWAIRAGCVLHDLARATRPSLAGGAEERKQCTFELNITATEEEKSCAT